MVARKTRLVIVILLARESFTRLQKAKLLLINKRRVANMLLQTYVDSNETPQVSEGFPFSPSPCWGTTWTYSY